MSPPIGFVLVTHQNPEQTLLLCRKLSVMFADPPIAIHHDLSQTFLDRSAFPSNVAFVEASLRTCWGDISVVDALLSALRLLYEHEQPDWFVPLSTSDYPIQSAATILGELQSGPFDLYLDHRPAEDLGGRIPSRGLGELPFRHPFWAHIAYRRYIALPLCSPRTARRLRMQVENLSFGSPLLTRICTPFHDGLQCFAGDSWFAANRRVARVLLDRNLLFEKLHRHYSTRTVPEESFYQTLLCATPGLSISPDNKRYTDWRGTWAHPRLLGREDLPRLLASSHHFARKFPHDPALFAELDAAVEARDEALVSLRQGSYG